MRLCQINGYPGVGYELSLNELHIPNRGRMCFLGSLRGVQEDWKVDRSELAVDGWRAA